MVIHWIVCYFAQIIAFWDRSGQMFFLSDMQQRVQISVNNTQLLMP